MIKDAIILAGGFGTRLKTMVDETPKSMAPIGDKPFLTYLFEYLLKFKIERAVIAAGYKHEKIFSYFGDYYKKIKLIYSIEDKPLGTGGAILKAIGVIDAPCCYVLNGDTYFYTDLQAFEESFNKNNPVISVALKPMVRFARYGSVTTCGVRIKSFNEKKFCESGLINGGVYILNKEWLIKNAPGEVFSFEKDILEKYAGKDFLGYFLSNAYFIDIGIPEDYLKASKELPNLLI